MGIEGSKLTLLVVYLVVLFLDSNINGCKGFPAIIMTYVVGCLVLCKK